MQIDIVPRYLPGGPCVSCFNAIVVVSRYPTGQQYTTKRSVDAVQFLLQVWRDLGVPDYTQVDNESCFSGGFTHLGVLGKVLRLGLMVGTELVFSPMPDLTLAPVFLLVSCQKIFTRIPDFQLVLGGFLVVQSIHTYQFDGGLDLTVCLKFQMVRHVS